jgi:hypothetical protein
MAFYSMQAILCRAQNFMLYAVRGFAMRLSNMKKTYRPILHGVGWPGDLKEIA